MNSKQNNESYKIQVDNFEGPFDLLLFFIERDELDIHSLSITSITNDFLEYIRQITELNITLSAEFIFMAARLMKIKSKNLLPGVIFEEEKEEYSAEELAKKLLEYKKIKLISQYLSALETERSFLHDRGNKGEELLEYELERVNRTDYYDYPNLLQLYRLYLKLVNNIVEESSFEINVKTNRYTIENQRKYIFDLLEVNQKINCLDVMKQSKDREQFVVSFIAILEMLQQRVLQIQILSGFNNFYLRKN